ncbi:hypothetical protein GSI_06102 [Ganoderma sinense ZZ0214-1]|uniref:WLM domain-containing protein n=1 Tax=Ganoderma sinense ZZ0214-1 TaxID=1077348 RepID=A0A2G8SCC7_9APHY|nr:hypothetical protein GSI_06102 [Ganoderma sinense ZZ0214-1]
MVRLRAPHAPDTFLPEENVLGTMLHELTHNVHGPHDAAFYKFLSGLEDEYDALRRSGYAGEGFHAPGQRLGTNVSHNLPLHLARAKAAEAADKRRQVSVVMRGGVRLGGVPRRNANKSPRELAAEAAERRARDELACASGAVAQREAEKAAKESIRNDVIDLTSDSESEPEILIIDEDLPSPPSEPPSASESTSSESTSSSSSTLLPSPPDRTSSSSSISSLSSTMSTSSRTPRPLVRRVPRGAGDAQPKIPKPRSHSRVAGQSGSVTPVTPTPPPTRAGSLVIPRHVRERTPLSTVHPIPALAPPPSAAIPHEKEWECPRCTLINDALALQCAACLGVRPNLSSKTPTPKQPVGEHKADGWQCGVCGEAGMPHDIWSCRFCGSVKATS